jgi:SAM-dependent methyltransferase
LNRVDMRAIAPGLTLDPAGYWRAPGTWDVSYPEGAHARCAELEDRSAWFAHRNRAVLAAVRRYPPESGPIFDVGAGNGFVATALERAGFPTVAIEPSSEGALAAVRREVANVVCGVLPSDAFRHETAGAIGMFDVIEHIEDDRGTLAALRPYLRPGGRLYLTTPAYPWLWSDVDEFSGHYRRYTVPQLREVVEAAGYRVDYATYIFWAVPPVLFLTRRFRRRNAPPPAGEHTLGGSLVRRAVEWGFGVETPWIARGRAIPFGGSCLLVASGRL